VAFALSRSKSPISRRLETASQLQVHGLMTIVSALQAGAFGASAILGVELRWRMFALLALVASALELALTFGVIYVSLRGVPLGDILGLVLVVAGALCWRNAASKLSVTAASIVVVAGAVPLLASLL
jgi:hypothetical protein